MILSLAPWLSQHFRRILAHSGSRFIKRSEAGDAAGRKFDPSRWLQRFLPQCIGYHGLISFLGVSRLTGDGVANRIGPVIKESDRHVCNWYCHNQGSARIYCMIGYNLAEAMKPLLQKVPKRFNTLTGGGIAI